MNDREMIAEELRKCGIGPDEIEPMVGVVVELVSAVEATAHPER